MDNTPMALSSSERESLLRAYADGRVSWRELQARGFESYLDVLGGLGQLHLRPPIAPMEGPNRASRERGRAIIRQALQARR